MYDILRTFSHVGEGKKVSGAARSTHKWSYIIQVKIILGLPLARPVSRITPSRFRFYSCSCVCCLFVDCLAVLCDTTVFRYRMVGRAHNIIIIVIILAHGKKSNFLNAVKEAFVLSLRYFFFLHTISEWARIRKWRNVEGDGERERKKKWGKNQIFLALSHSRLFSFSGWFLYFRHFIPDWNVRAYIVWSNMVELNSLVCACVFLLFSSFFSSFSFFAKIANVPFAWLLA